MALSKELQALFDQLKGQIASSEPMEQAVLTEYLEKGGDINHIDEDTQMTLLDLANLANRVPVIEDLQRHHAKKAQELQELVNNQPSAPRVSVASVVHPHYLEPYVDDQAAAQVSSATPPSAPPSDDEDEDEDQNAKLAAMTAKMEAMIARLNELEQKNKEDNRARVKVLIQEYVILLQKKFLKKKSYNGERMQAIFDELIKNPEFIGEINKMVSVKFDDELQKEETLIQYISLFHGPTVHLQKLLELGADPRILDENNRNALSYTCTGKGEGSEAAKLLLTFNENQYESELLNQQDNEGYFPFGRALNSNADALQSVFVQNVSDPTVLNSRIHNDQTTAEKLKGKMGEKTKQEFKQRVKVPEITDLEGYLKQDAKELSEDGIRIRDQLVENIDVTSAITGKDPFAQLINLAITNGHFDVAKQLFKKVFGDPEKMSAEDKLKALYIAVDQTLPEFALMILRILDPVLLGDIREVYLNRKDRSAVTPRELAVFTLILEHEKMSKLNDVVVNKESLADAGYLKKNPDDLRIYKYLADYAAGISRHENARFEDAREIIMQVIWDTHNDADGRQDINDRDQIEEYLFKNPMTLLQDIRDYKPKQHASSTVQPIRGVVTRPLIAAIRRGKFEVVKMLLNHSVMPIFKDPVNGNTALHEAAESALRGEEHPYFDLFFRKGWFDTEFLNMTNNKGQTALQMLVEGNKDTPFVNALIAQLIQMGAKEKVDVVVHNVEQPPQAVPRDEVVVVHNVVQPAKMGTEKNPITDSQLMKMIWKREYRYRDIDVFKNACDAESIDSQHQENLTRIYQYKASGWVGKKFNIEGAPTTLLHAAIRRGKDNFALELLQRGADPSQIDPMTGNTCLHEAALTDTTQTFYQAFLKCDKDNRWSGIDFLKIKNKQGKTVRDILKERNRNEFYNELLSMQKTNETNKQKGQPKKVQEPQQPQQPQQPQRQAQQPEQPQQNDVTPAEILFNYVVDMKVDDIAMILQGDKAAEAVTDTVFEMGIQSENGRIKAMFMHYADTELDVKRRGELQAIKERVYSSQSTQQSLYPNIEAQDQSQQQRSTQQPLVSAYQTTVYKSPVEVEDPTPAAVPVPTYVKPVQPAAPPAANLQIDLPATLATTVATTTTAQTRNLLDDPPPQSTAPVLQPTVSISTAVPVQFTEKKTGQSNKVKSKVVEADQKFLDQFAKAPTKTPQLTTENLIDLDSGDEAEKEKNKQNGKTQVKN